MSATSLWSEMVWGTYKTASVPWSAPQSPWPANADGDMASLRRAVVMSNRWLSVCFWDDGHFPFDFEQHGHRGRWSVVRSDQHHQRRQPPHPHGDKGGSIRFKEACTTNIRRPVRMQDTTAASLRGNCTPRSTSSVRPLDGFRCGSGLTGGRPSRR